MADLQRTGVKVKPGWQQEPTKVLGTVSPCTDTTQTNSCERNGNCRLKPTALCMGITPRENTTASSQAYSQDFFLQTAGRPDFAQRDLCRTQTVRRFSDRSAKLLQGSSIVFMSICSGWKKKKPRGLSVEGRSSLHRGIHFIRLPPVNYLDSSWERPIIPWPFCVPCQSGSTFNLLWSLWHFQLSLTSGSPNQTHQFKICQAALVLTHIPHLSFSSSSIKSKC